MLEESLIFSESTETVSAPLPDGPRLAAAPEKIALIVGGVGRSGTSALTRVLNLLGATLPEQVIPPGWGNEKGFWEPRAIVELSDEILRGFGSNYFDTRPLPGDWYQRAAANGYVERIAGTIERSYRGGRLIVIKDPRICRLGRLYFAALDRLGYTPRIILPVRQPGETVASLHRRDGTDPRISELVWVRHMLETEAVTRGYKRIWVSYDWLLRDWRGLAGSIADTLGVTWPVDAEDAAAAVDAFLDPDMRHFDSATRHAVLPVGPTAARLWACVRRQTPDIEARIRQDFDAIGSIVQDLDRLQAAQAVPDSARIDGLNQVIADLNGHIRALQADPSTVPGLRHQMDTLRKRAEALEQATRDAWRTAAAALADVPAARTLFGAEAAEPAMLTAITDALAALQADSKATADHLDIVLQSRSWALTRPLRWLRSLSRRLG